MTNTEGKKISQPQITAQDSNAEYIYIIEDKYFLSYFTSPIIAKGVLYISNFYLRYFKGIGTSFYSNDFVVVRRI